MSDEDEASCDDFICKNEKPTINLGSNPFPERSVNRMPVKESPLNVSEIGHATWPILHRMSLSYPNQPTHIQQVTMSKVIYGFSHIYACKDCAKDFRATLEQKPPMLQSRKDLALWLCD